MRGVQNLAGIALRVTRIVSHSASGPAGRKTALRNAALAAAAANPEILPLELLLGDHPFMDR
jgi:hypothetical protein